MRVLDLDKVRAGLPLDVLLYEMLSPCGFSFRNCRDMATHVTARVRADDGFR